MQQRRRTGKFMGNRGSPIEAPEDKGGDGMHSARMLLFDSCQDCGTGAELLSLVLQGRVVRMVS